MLGLIRMLVVGLIIGILARFIYPGAVPLNWLWSIVLGIVGSYIGGLIHMAIDRNGANKPLHPAGILLSIVGAILVIFVCKHFLHIL